MLRPVRGVLAVEGIQTGDGRIMAANALSWLASPMPFAWLSQGDQHTDAILTAPQIGTINEASRFGNEILWSGIVDDAIPEGREFVRRMEEGSAPLGHRFGVSIDGDDYRLELVLNTDEGFDVVMIASGAGRPPKRDALVAMMRSKMPGLVASIGASGEPTKLVGWRVFGDMTATLGLVPVDGRALTADAALSALTAAAGDGDIVGEVLFTDSADSLLLRFTRMRIRGAVGLAIGAFAEAYVELAPRAVTADAAAPVVLRADDLSSVRHVNTATSGWTFTASAVPLVRGLVGPDRPAVELFEPITTEPDGSLNIDGEHVSGYIATFETCHTGYTDRCVLAPREPDYGLFHHGAVELETGERQRVGVFTWGIPHADLTEPLIRAQAHYADARCGFAHVVVGANEYGIWHSGVLRSGITKDDVRDLQALSMSGDWRYRPGEGLRLIASLAVNYPGFPVPRRQAMAAGAGMMTAGPAVHFGDDGQVLALVAAGMVAPAEPHGHGDCGCDGAVLRAQLEDLSPLVLAALDRQVGSWRKDGPVVHMPRLSRAGRVPVLPR